MRGSEINCTALVPADCQIRMLHQIPCFFRAQCRLHLNDSVADPGLPRGVPTPKGRCQSIAQPIFLKNCIEMKDTGPGGGAYVENCLCKSVTAKCASSAVMAKARSGFRTHAMLGITVAPLKEIQKPF